MGRFYYLTPVLGGPGAPRYPIHEGKQLIGRSEQAHIALLEPTVSREHAYVYCQQERVVLEDLESKHGTFVNSKRVDRRQLHVGDIVVFGLSLVLRLEESDSPVPPFQQPTGSDPTESLPSPRQTGALEPTVTRSSGSASDHELDHIRELAVKLRKLATIGAQAAGRLPVLKGLVAELDSALPRENKVALALVEQIRQEFDAWTEEAHVMVPRATESVALLEIAQRSVSVVKGQADNAEIGVACDIEPSVMVLTNAPRLQSALTHLLRNAIEASSRAGSIQVTCACEGEWAFLAIADRGKGINDDQLERLFDPFVTLKADWRIVGLGLFEARQIITELGGRLELESRVGQGTIAHVTLPLA